MNIPSRTVLPNWPSYVPHGWEVLRLKWLVLSVESGVSVNATNESAAAGELGVLKTSAVAGGIFFPYENKAVWDSETDRVMCPVRCDTVIMSRMNTPSLVAESGYVDRNHPDLFLPDRLWQITFDPKRVFTPFMAKVLACSGARSTLSEMATGTSGSMKNLTQEDMLNLPVPLPPLALQRIIADYLDWETSRLDSLVVAKERVLGLLAEKRRALITRAVTRGLDPNAPLRDSSIPWLGEIPAHWELIPLRFLVDIVGGATPDTGKAEFWDGDIPWVSPKDMKRDEIEDAEDHVTRLALTSSALRLIEPGAVLIVVRGMILAHSFPTAVTTQTVTINQDMKALRCRASLQPRFLRGFFRGTETQVVSLADASAHGTRKLETEVLGRFEVCVPPLEEQRAIVAHIEKETAKLDALREATERTIGLLKERRAALIAAAVTGKIQVPSAP
ncbi:MAG: restriction endonuclease subunit S [Candidatus Binatia bacterium]